MQLLQFCFSPSLLVGLLLSFLVFLQLLSGDCPLIGGLDFSIDSAGLILIGFCPSFHDHVLLPKFSQYGKLKNSQNADDSHTTSRDAGDIGSNHGVRIVWIAAEFR